MLIFDLDGTLWETLDTTLEASNEIVRENPEVKEITMDTVVKGMGLSSKENAKNYMPYLDEEIAINYIKMISDRNFELIKENGAHIYDGVYDTIKSLSKKYKLGIVTNNYDEYAKVFLDKSNLGKYFTDYMGAASYSITKGEAIKKMVDKYNEDNSYYIGDIKKDMKAAYEADINFIHAKYEFEKDLDTNLYINDIRELEELLNNIGKR